MKSGRTVSLQGKLLGVGIVGVVSLTAFLLVGSLLYAEEGDSSSVLRSRVFKLSDVTSEQVIEHLNTLKIGTKASALSEKVLIVTSDVSGDLTRASSLIETLDTEDARQIRRWEPSAEYGFPPLEQLAASMKGATVGSLMDSPGKTAKNPLLLDIQAGTLVAIGAPEQVSGVDEWIAQWHKQQAGAAAPVPATEPALSLQELASTLMPDAQEKELRPTPQPAPVEEATTEPMEAVEMPQPEAVEPSVTEAQPTAQPEVPSEEIAEAAAEEMIEGTEKDFFTEELLQALASEEKKAADIEKKIQEQKAEPLEPAVPAQPETPSAAQEASPVDEPATEVPAAPQEDEGDKLLMDFLKSLQQQGQQPGQEAAPQELLPAPVPQEPASPVRSPAETGTSRPQAPGKIVSAPRDAHMDRLESQLADAQQQIAELKELLMARLEAQSTPPADPYKELRTMSEPEIPGGGTELELVDMTLPQTVELTQLLELVGKQLGLNYMYDPQQIRGNVQLMLHDGKIKVKDVYALLESVMRFRGFVMTRRGNLVTIVPQNQIAQVDPEIMSPNEPIKPGDVLVSSIFQLQNITPQTAQNMLTQMKLGTTGGFVPVQETGSLIVTDYAYRMERIQKVIDMVDVPGDPKEFKSRVVEYMQASEMVAKLQNLTAQMEDVSIAGASGAATGTPAAPTPPRITRDARGRIVRTPQTAAPAVPGAQPAPGTALAEKETVFLDTDDRTNRILMIGYPDQIEMINELIATLDVPGYNLRYVKEYVILNVEATEIINSLNELGLAQVSVSSDTSAPVSNARQRVTPPRPGQPAQPQPVQQPSVTSSGGGEQPYISVRPNTNSLLVNATKEQHEAIELVIVHVDVEQKDQRRIEEYEIQNVGASDVVATLENLGIIPSGTASQSESNYGSRGGRSSLQQRGGVAQQPNQPQEMGGPVFLPTAEGETVRDLTSNQPQIAILESTNSLLVNATPRQHAAIALVIAHVDRTITEVATPYVVYPLENQDPEKLSLVLNELIQETLEQQAQRSAPDAKIQTGVSTATVLPTREEERVRIIPDPASYSLIVYANKKNQLWVQDLISELDEYRPQVLLDCTLVEITHQDDFNYDLNILASIPDLNYTSGTTNITGIDRQGILDSLLAAPDRSEFLDFAIDSGKLTGFFGNDKIMALFTAMQEKKYGRILAKPKILVDDNQAGKIETKTTTYIQRDIIQNQVPDQGAPITYTETTFEPYDATILLSIKPHISKGDNLRLEIELSRTDFLNFEANSERPPNQATSNVNSVVTLPDGSTVILGGLDKINQGKGGTKVPILGDIPLIGGLFRSTTNTSQQNKLYVFVKANILRPGTDMASEDLKNISRKYRGEFEEREDEMQRYDDWPGIPPKPMDPKNVLEMDD